MAIVMEWKSGNCTIRIDDKYVVNTPEAKAEAIKNIEDIYPRAIAKRRTKSTNPELYPEFRKYYPELYPEYAEKSTV